MVSILLAIASISGPWKNCQLLTPAGMIHSLYWRFSSVAIRGMRLDAPWLNRNPSLMTADCIRGNRSAYFKIHQKEHYPQANVTVRFVPGQPTKYGNASSSTSVTGAPGVGITVFSSARSFCKTSGL